MFSSVLPFSPTLFDHCNHVFRILTLYVYHMQYICVLPVRKALLVQAILQQAMPYVNLLYCRVSLSH
jgi:hypothetical protein